MEERRRKAVKQEENEVNDPDDQIARLQRELKEGKFLKIVRQRSQRRKRAWHRLLMAVLWPLWLVITYVSVKFFYLLHTVIYSNRCRITS